MSQWRGGGVGMVVGEGGGGGGGGGWGTRCPMSHQGGEGRWWQGWWGNNEGGVGWGEPHKDVSRPTCSMRSTCRVILAAIPKSTSFSKDGSLVMELTLTMLLRRALARVNPSNPAGLLGKSKLAPPPLLLLAGGGILTGLPCIINVCCQQY